MRIHFLLIGLMLCGLSARAETIDRSRLPEPSTVTNWTPPPVEIWQLENGITVWHVVQKHTALASISLVLPNGAETDPVGKAGLASLMVDLMDEGADGLSAIELSDAMQRIAMGYSGRATTDALTFSMNILSEQLAPSFSLFAKILLKPNFTEDDFTRRKAQRLAAVLADEANQMSAAGRVLSSALYGDGYLGLSTGGIQSSLSAIEHSDISKVYGTLVHPTNAILIAVGDLERSALEDALKSSGIADWRAKKGETKARVVTEAPVLGIHVVDFPNSAQTAIMFAKRAAGAQDPERYQDLVFNHGFAGSFTSRVNLNLREDKGYTYGARGYFRRSLKGGVYSIYAKVKRDTTRPSIDELMTELSQVTSDKPITQLERDNAVGGLLKGYPSYFERVASVASQLTSLATQKRQPSALANFAKRIESIELKDALKSAQSHAQISDFVIVLAGDWSAIKKEIETLNMPIYFYTADGRRKSKSNTTKAN